MAPFLDALRATAPRQSQEGSRPRLTLGCVARQRWGTGTPWRVLTVVNTSPRAYDAAEAPLPCASPLQAVAGPHATPLGRLYVREALPD